MYIFIQLIPYEEVTLYGIGLRIYGVHFLVATLWCQTWPWLGFRTVDTRG